jgi:hypothetical protein
MVGDMDKWKTAEAKTAASQAFSSPIARALEDLRQLKGLIHYRILGEGSSRENLSTGESSAFLTEDQKRQARKFEKEVDQARRTLSDLLRDASALDEYMGYY